MKDMVEDYMVRQTEKENRARVRIKEKLLMIHEKNSMKKFEENDPGFNRTVIHLKRVVKIMTAQT